MEKDVKTSVPETTDQCAVTSEPALLVEVDELDAGQVVDEGSLSLSDDPGNPAFGSGVLECSDDGDHMADVTDGRQA